MSKNIAVTYEKGGVGKTTTAVNVAAILAERGYNVLLVDLDQQSYATSYYDMYDDTKPGIYELMQGKVTAMDVVQSTDVPKLEIIPATTSFKNIDTVLMTMTRMQEFVLKKALSPITEFYDYIIMDCPPSGNRVKTNALTFADYVLLPTIPDDYFIHGLMCMAEEIVDIRSSINPQLEVLGVLVTIDERTANKRAYKAALQGQDVFPCFETAIRKNTALSAAINAHKPINLYDKRCNGTKDYNALVDEILAKTEKAGD